MRFYRRPPYNTNAYPIGWADFETAEVINGKQGVHALRFGKTRGGISSLREKSDPYRKMVRRMLSSEEESAGQGGGAGEGRRSSRLRGV